MFGLFFHPAGHLTNCDKVSPAEASSIQNAENMIDLGIPSMSKTPGVPSWASAQKAYHPPPNIFLYFPISCVLVSLNENGKRTEQSKICR
jgi:hypothetical protein